MNETEEMKSLRIAGGGFGSAEPVAPPTEEPTTIPEAEEGNHEDPPQDNEGESH